MLGMESSNRIVQLFRYSTDFYFRKLPQLLVFSIPMLIALLIPLLVATPTFVSLGAVVMRTGSLPELTIGDIAFTAFAYALSLFIIADAIANINILIKSKRTMTSLSSQVIAALSTYGLRIFYIYTIMMLMFAIFQLLTFEQPFQTWLYPLLMFLLSALLFFVAPAIVIDDAPVQHAISHSIRASLGRPRMFLIWTVTGFLLVSAVRLLLGVVVPSLASPLTLIINALFILPFLIILQTQMYMEKYPMAH